jgi:hypothetical protein
MARSALANIDYYFRRERLIEDGRESAHARIIGDRSLGISGAKQD